MWQTTGDKFDYSSQYKQSTYLFFAVSMNCWIFRAAWFCVDCEYVRFKPEVFWVFSFDTTLFDSRVSVLPHVLRLEDKAESQPVVSDCLNLLFSQYDRYLFWITARKGKWIKFRREIVFHETHRQQRESFRGNTHTLCIVCNSFV